MCGMELLIHSQTSTVARSNDTMCTQNYVYRDIVGHQYITAMGGFLV